MERLRFSIVISAPRESVWHAILDGASCRIWTEPFAPGSYYLGDRDEGSGATEVNIDMDVESEHVAMMREIWPVALQKLKDIAEE